MSDTLGAVITILNCHASTAFNGTITYSFLVIN